MTDETTTREEKITELLTRIGIPRSDFDVVRPNYERLSDKDLDSKLALFREAATQIAKWRVNRGSAT